MRWSWIFFLSVFFLFWGFFFSGILNITKAQPVDLGITGGINLSSHLQNFRYSNGNLNLDLNPQMSTGYQVGLFARKEIAPSLRLQIEPSLILLGAMYKESITLQEFDFRTNSRTELLYFQLPILVQLSKTPPLETVFGLQKSKTMFHLAGGIYAEYLLNALFSGTNTGTPIGISFKGDFSNDVSSQYSNFGGGILLGAGFEHGLDRKIGFETRALFSPIDSGSKQAPFFEPKNIAIIFSVYYLL